jgi:hypothetical protein
MLVIVADIADTVVYGPVAHVFGCVPFGSHAHLVGLSVE